MFAANDLVAMGVLQALNMSGANFVPDDIALVGYDDIDFASAAVVPLSSVRQPSQLIGATAVQILLEEAADPTLEPRQVVFQPELVVRESTRARSPGAAAHVARGYLARGTNRSSWVTWPGSSSSREATPSRRIVRATCSPRISIVRSTPSRPPAMRP